MAYLVGWLVGGLVGIFFRPSVRLEVLIGLQVYELFRFGFDGWLVGGFQSEVSVKTGIR